MQRIPTRLVLVAALAMVAALGVVAPANAAPAWVTFWNQHTERCLDDSYQYRLRVQECNSSNSQRWAPTYISAYGTWTFRNLHTNRCLHDNPREGLIVYTCSQTPPQQWKVHLWDDDTSEVYNPYTDKCLDDSYQANLRTFECNASPSQSWYGLHTL